MQDSEKELVGKATGGDRTALVELLQRAMPVLRRRFESMVPTRWQSVLTIDDILQETCTDAFLEVNRFTPRGEGSFLAWVSTIAKNNLLSTIEMLEAEKRGGQRKRVELRKDDDSYDDLYGLIAGHATTPSQHAARNDARDALRKAIQQLPEDYRRVVQIYDLEGCSVEDASALLNRRPGAVFMLRARAHRALQKLLGAPANYLSSTA